MEQYLREENVRAQYEAGESGNFYWETPFVVWLVDKIPEPKEKWESCECVCHTKYQKHKYHRTCCYTESEKGKCSELGDFFYLKEPYNKQKGRTHEY